MKFEKQEYQTNCVSNIVELLKDFNFNSPNLINLQSSFVDFYKNQGKNIPVQNISNRMNVDILMETGTGKTFTYIKTMFELNKQYGLNKFIIFVPRKAIKLGIKQNIKLTKEYFLIEYAKELDVFEYEGSSKNKQSSIPIAINRFIDKTNKNISVLILTSGSIDKKDNILNRKQERNLVTGIQATRIPLEALKNINPVVIIDEPHLLKGNKFTEFFTGFKNIHLRFGATFPKEQGHELSNIVYALDSISAFQQYLVKKIRVSTLINNNQAVKLISTTKNTIKITYFNNNEEQTCTININEDIGIKTSVANLYGVTCTKIKNETAYLSNGNSLTKSAYIIEEEEKRSLIKTTINKHFKKEETLYKLGIKTLSLFFINNIADFKGDNPTIKRIFEEEYTKIRLEILNNKNLDKQYKKYLQNDFLDNKLQVHDGYFADSGGSKDDIEAKKIDLILNKKEELLSLDTPLRFIFSVWALQEGWDNPNIFNICKLSATNSDTSRRQQVGRGLRIAVNQQGNRLTKNFLLDNSETFYDINTLDVIVSGQEEQFIYNLQAEINDNSYTIANSLTFSDIKTKTNLNDREITKFITKLEENNIIEFDENKDTYVIESSVYNFIQNNSQELNFLSTASYSQLLNIFKESENKHKQIEDANKPKTMVKINKELYKEFKDLWKLINTKAHIVYSKDLSLKLDELIKNITHSFCSITINPVNIIIKTEEYNPQTNSIVQLESNTLGEKDFIRNSNFFTDFLLNLAKELEDHYPLSFLLQIINNIIKNNQGKQNIINNPKIAKYELKKAILNNSHKYLLQSVSYNLESTIEISNNEIDNISILQGDEIEHTKLGTSIAKEETPKHYLYNKIVYHSEIEKLVTIKDPTKVDNKEITVFAKLPQISIKTPYETYSPDFAYVIKDIDGTKLFLVVETKGYNSQQDIPPKEQLKIDYAEKFFAKLQEVSTDNKLKIAFKSRINKQELINIVTDVINDR